MLSVYFSDRLYTHASYTVFLKPAGPESAILLGSNQRQEHVEGNLDGVNKDETVLAGDELEIDGVHNGPDLPGSLAGGQQIILDLVANGVEGVAVAEAQVGEEYRHEDGAPQDLINANLEGHVLSAGSLDLAVEPVVEVVSRGSVVDETKDRKSHEALPIEGSARNEDLSQNIPEPPSHERSHGLGKERFAIQRIIVGGPTRNGTSSDDGRVPEERRGHGGIFAEGSGWLGDLGYLGHRRVDAKGGHRKERRGNQDEGR
jgi:hypothetical protein